MTTKKPYHETVAENLIKQLEAGTAPWQKPWESGMPINPTTGNRYKGINAIHLMAQGKSDPRWMTYKQASAQGAQVRKGEKGTLIQYWKYHEERNKKDENGKVVLDDKGKPIKEKIKLGRPKPFSAVVFNAKQIDGLPEMTPQKPWNNIERAEHILQQSHAAIYHGEPDGAFYRPSTDSIHLPNKEQFPNAENYYSVALHELGHWTGHSSRLDRDLSHPFGSEGYAREELRAEIGSMILSTELGIAHDTNQHAAYVKSWIKALKEDPLEIFRAASDAEKISQFAMSFDMKQTHDAHSEHKSDHTQKHYLAVPYNEKNQAKAAGAKWDKSEKSWYVDTTSNLQPFERWLPQNTPANSERTPREEFADALASIGCEVDGEHPIMDGEKHRIRVETDKPNVQHQSGSGYYVGYLDGHPAGFMKNYKTGEELTWKSSGQTLDPQAQAKMRAEAANKRLARAERQQQLHQSVRDRVTSQIATLLPVTAPTPYMQAKGILPYTGVYTDAHNQTTYIPAYDKEGKQWTMQYIQADGTKRFAKDSRKAGCFHVVGGHVASLEQVPAIVVQEGYATAASISEAVGFATVAAFDSGNLLKVAKDLHDKFPDKPVIICGDNDRHTEMLQGINPGKDKALEAANAVGGTAIFPEFPPKANYPTHLPLITPESYRQHQAAQKGQAPKDQLLSRGQLNALNNLKQFTDFNDLNTVNKESVITQTKNALQEVCGTKTSRMHR